MRRRGARSDRRRSAIHRTREQELLQQTGSQVETDKLMRAEGAQLLRQHFFKHLATTVPFAYQGIFVSPRLYLWSDIYLLKGTYVCYLLFLSLFVRTIQSLRTRNAVLFAFLAPSLFSYAFFSFFTHNIARYNTPLLPIRWLATIIVRHRYIARHRPGAHGSEPQRREPLWAWAKSTTFVAISAYF